jgi:hypothetical protein
MTRFDSSGVATLQLSTDDLSVIFDCVALETSEPYKAFLLQFFADENIEKIGHSFSSDIHALNSTFNIELVSACLKPVSNSSGIQQYHQH